MVSRQPLLQVYTKSKSVWGQKCLFTTSFKHCAEPKKNTEIDVTRESPFSELSTKEKVKEAGKTSFWGGVFIVGVGCTGGVV